MPLRGTVENHSEAATRRGQMSATAHRLQAELNADGHCSTVHLTGVQRAWHERARPP